MTHLSQVTADDGNAGLPGPSTATTSDDAGVLTTTADDADGFTTTVYGSQFAAHDLPEHTLPENEMPRDVAYRLIKDELSLDGNPQMK